MLLLLLFLTPFSAYGEPIPDYNNPYAPIYTDSPRYSWTDKMTITIVAPSWNSNRNLINSIGGTTDHSIMISSGKHSLGPYRFTETAANSGVFTAEVTLTGFLHDADGDGRTDTTPRTGGNGPTSGFLQTDRDSAVAISFEFADGVILTESVPVDWNIGEVKFSGDVIFSDEPTTVLVNDPDMNLNPEALDSVQLEIFSDSDAAGIRVGAIETSKSSGSFVAAVSFDQSTSSGNRLYVVLGDGVTARYTDYTLPKPYSISDSMRIEGSAVVGSSVPATERLINHSIKFSDSLGNKMTSFSPNSQIQIVGSIANEHNFVQKFVYIFQIKNSTGYIESLSWIQGVLAPEQDLSLSQSWTPQRSGTYEVETFIWDSLDGANMLAGSATASITIG